jgi:acetyl-CoA synthetase
MSETSKQQHRIDFTGKREFFPPPLQFAANAHIKSFEEYERIYNEAAADPPIILGGKLQKNLHWFKKNGTRFWKWNEPFAKWFVGGKN